MRSKGSFFNFTVLLRDITRFFPVWSLFSVFLGLAWLGLQISQSRYLGNELASFYSLMPFWLAVYAVVCALTLFGDLYKGRLCNALHAMPLRREGWFFTHAAAGMLFFLVPFALFAVLTVPLGVRWGFAGIALGLGTLEFLLFFGMALLCVMLAGNRVGAVLLFGLLNFLAPVLQWIAETLFQPFLYGVPLQADAFSLLSPVLQLPGEGELLFFNYMDPWGGVTFSLWGYVLICGGIGLVFAAGALLLYRRRALETAGDFISVRFLRPVFVVAFSLLVAVALFGIIGHDASQVVFLIPYMALGFFFGRMLVMRSIRVFQPMAFLGYGVLVIALFGSLGLCKLDLVGITRQVPRLEQVSAVQVHLDQHAHGSYYTSYFYDGDRITDPECLDILLRFHEDAVRTRPSGKEKSGMLYLTYYLSNGTTLRRYYPIEPLKEGQVLLPVFSSWEAVFDGISPEEFARRVTSVRALGSGSEIGIYFGEKESPYTKDVQIQAPQVQKLLLQHLQEDCKQGTMAQQWRLYDKEYENSYDLEIWLEGENGSADTCLYLMVYPDSDTFLFLNTCYCEGRIREDRTLTEENADLSRFA